MDFGFDFIKIAACKNRNQLVDFFDGLVPPFEFQQEFRQFFVESVADDFGGISDHDRVGFHVATDDAVCTDDGVALNSMSPIKS